MKNFIIKYKSWILISLAFHIIASFFSVGHLHPDEHYQLLEFLGYKLGTTPSSDLPWEFSAKMRPWFQPGIYYIITKFFSIFGLEDRFALTYIFRLLSITLGFVSSLHLAKFCYEKYRHNIPVYLSLLFWPLPFLHARLSSEALAASIFTFALLSFFNNSKKGLIKTGVLFGLTFLLRYHCGFMIFGLCLWSLIKKEKSVKELSILTITTMSVIGMSILVDFWGYGEMSFAPYHYTFQNIVENKAANYGVSPWWYYFKAVFNKLIAPIGITVIISFLITWIRKPLSWITFTTLPFFVIHCLIGHKEWRFLFPLIPFVPLVAGETIELFSKVMNKRAIRYWIYLLAICNSLLLFTAFKSVHQSYDFYKSLRSIEKFDVLYHNSHETPLSLASLKPHFYKPFFPKHIKIQDNQLEEYARNGGHFFVERGRFAKALELIPSCKNIYYGSSELIKLLPERLYDKQKIYSLWKCQK